MIDFKLRLMKRYTSNFQHITVVGDRRLLRFYRGKGGKMDETVNALRAFLKWRDANNVDKIRQDIVYGGKDTPLKFPDGERIIAIAPQIVISSHAMDKKGRLLGTFVAIMCTYYVVPSFLSQLTSTYTYYRLLQPFSHGNLRLCTEGHV